MSDELSEVVRAHRLRYPEMEAQDLIKLIYQNEFGVGHLIEDEDVAFARLKDEWLEVTDLEGESIALFDPIGNGLCRLHLRELKKRAYAREETVLKAIVRLMKATAAEVNGSQESFERKAKAVYNECRHSKLKATFQEAILHEARGDVHHSNLFREAYHPAYRIIKEAFAKHIPLYIEMERQLECKKSIVVAIDGPCGSGKSTLAERIKSVYDANVIHMDDFYLPRALRTEERLKEPGGNLHRERFMEEVFPKLKTGQTFSYRQFDCRIMDFGAFRAIEERPVTVVEGSYSQRPEFVEAYDLKVFLGISESVQQKRIKARNDEEALSRFNALWIPMENIYFGTFNVEEKADLWLNGE